MIKKMVLAGFCVACFIQFVFGEKGDIGANNLSTSSSMSVPAAKPLTIYSGGVSIGAFMPMNHELESVSRQFLKLTFVNRIYFSPRSQLFIDADAFFPHTDLGLNGGVHFYFSDSQVRPFIGAGAGVHSFKRENSDFGSAIGPSATARAGVLLDVTESFMIECTGAYLMTGNHFHDNGIAFSLGFLFSEPYRSIKKVHE
ncbi:MAG: hypothetical protein JW795_21245 [Chitinivibrionales bacterium]|nr:hypothetical protein [Chitinivibrionales bacterium]